MPAIRGSVPRETGDETGAAVDGSSALPSCFDVERPCLLAGTNCPRWRRSAAACCAPPHQPHHPP
ncbi:hypothetical protein WK32_10250 [Burkholderia vietnamiensis]|uniref:Uncharacterized protein n=1 Tax=Burkholderia vietnamiensis TaxID=60552 RepID=A0AA44XU01_BURVI|nr:hypothetical protein WK32_10250 [Burkholderia vietnamiensis]PRH38298.1 hypothetical protein C6T65_32695 [Burkholderia vietnamiensis]